MSIEQRIERYAAPWIHAIEPYEVGDAAGLAKLDAMENPYSIPERLRSRWNALLANVDANRYPDPAAAALKQAWLAAHDLGSGVGVTLGNGSDELIHLLCLAFAGGRSPCVLCPEPTFAVYAIAARTLGMTYESVSRDPVDFSLDTNRMLDAIARCEPAVIFLASPNNPTGNRVDPATLEAVCARAPGVVVLDEAYWRFAGTTSVGDVAHIENLVVMHTMSKIGLAGLRVGALFGASAWIELVERLRMPYNINALSQAGALFALEHDDAFQPQIDAVVSARDALFRELDGLPGIDVWPSLTNFILFRTQPGSGTRVFESMKARGVLLRNLSGGHPMLEDCLRVTVGTAEENALFLNALGASLA